MRLIVAILFLWSLALHADTHNAATVSRADVAAAVAAAVDGDTVTIPAGSATWTNTLTISKWLKLEGAGIDQTVIIANVFNPGAEYQYAGLVMQGYGPNEVSGITWNGNNLTANPAITVWSGPTVRIHHCKFINCGKGIVVSGPFGVIDHCQFINFGGGVRINGWNGGQLNWDTYYPIPFNSLYYLFIEDCNFEINATLGTFGRTDFAYCSSGEGSSYVVRYCTFTNSFGQAFPCFDWHGDQPSDPTRGNLSSQIYKNTFVTSGTGSIGMFAGSRGGQSLVYSNTITGGGAFNNSVREEHTDGTLIRGVRYWDVATNVWNWENRHNGNLVATVCDSPGTACNMVSFHDAPYTGNFTQTYPHPLVQTPPPPQLPATISLTQTNYDTTETSGFVVVRAERTVSTTGAVGVTMFTEDSSAIAGHDYTSRIEELSWADGEGGTRSLSIQVLNSGDTATTNRVFRVRIWNTVGGATLGTYSNATVTIQMTAPVVPNAPLNVTPANGATDVSVTPTLTASAYSSPHNEAQTGFQTRILSGSTVAWTSTDQGVTNSMTLPAGILTDGLSYSWNARFINAVGAGDWSQATSFSTTPAAPPPPPPLPPPPTNAGTIYLSAHSYPTTETNGTVNVLVVRTGSTNIASTVAFTTFNGTATAGIDYTATAGTVTFAVNENAAKLVQIPILNSGTFGPPRVFFFTISNPSNGAELGLATAGVTIQMLQPVSVTTRVTLGNVTIYGGTLGGTNAP